MDSLVMASSAADARAAEQVVEHHAQLTGTLRVLSDSLLAAAAGADRQAAREASAALAAWCRSDLLPHAEGEERVLYPAARALPEGRLLVEGMLTEHALLADLADQAGAADPVRAAAAATALRHVLDSHVGKENELLVPLLAGSAEASLADLLAQLQADLAPTASGRDASDDADPAGASHGGDGHSCGCHETEAPGHPELDARSIPHAIRHSTIFGALDAVRPGRGLVLVAPHDPLPLLAQLERRNPDTFSVRYLERGPEAWRLELVRASRP